MRPKLINIIVNLRNNYSISGRGLIGAYLSSLYPNIAIDSLRPLHLNKKARILDVGCGAGHLLLGLNNIGFKDLTGVDPFLPNNIQYPNGPKIFRMDIHHLKGSWDVIMFHHSLEHLEHQIETLSSAAAILSPNGVIIVRIPLVNTFAWRMYGANWCQLDVPRHLFLHSLRSIKMAAESSGLNIYSVVYDSTAFQLWGSEQYKKNIPLRDSRSYYMNPKYSIFTKREIAEFEKRAEELNANQDGDQAILYLRKS